MPKVIPEAVKMTVRGMLLSGKTTPDIMYDAGVSKGVVTKIRKELIAEGKGVLWHTSDYLSDKGWA